MEECATLGQCQEPNTLLNHYVTKVTSSLPPHLHPECVRATASGMELFLSVKLL